MKDALGYPIVLGDKYGYSTSKNGYMMVTVGHARKLNMKSVTIEPISQHRFLHGEPISLNCPISKSISIHPAHLFPVQENKNDQSE